MRPTTRRTLEASMRHRPVTRDARPRQLPTAPSHAVPTGECQSDPPSLPRAIRCSRSRATPSTRAGPLDRLLHVRGRVGSPLGTPDRAEPVKSNETVWWAGANHLLRLGFVDPGGGRERWRHGQLVDKPLGVARVGVGEDVGAPVVELLDRKRPDRFMGTGSC